MQPLWGQSGQISWLLVVVFYISWAWVIQCHLWVPVPLSPIKNKHGGQPQQRLGSLERQGNCTFVRCIWRSFHPTSAGGNISQSNCLTRNRARNGLAGILFRLTVTHHLQTWMWTVKTKSLDLKHLNRSLKPIVWTQNILNKNKFLCVWRSVFVSYTTWERIKWRA